MKHDQSCMIPDSSSLTTSWLQTTTDVYGNLISEVILLSGGRTLLASSMSTRLALVAFFRTLPPHTSLQCTDWLREMSFL